MSITLTAYPTAFLISPQEAKKEKLHRANENKIKAVNKSVALKNLKFIRVLTNLSSHEFISIMENMFCKQLGFGSYVLSNGLKINCEIKNSNCILTVSGVQNPEQLQNLSEEFFQNLDSYLDRNVRLIGSNEYFYHNYETEFTNQKDIYENLKSQGAKNIHSTDEGFVFANVNGSNVKYYKASDSPNFMLESEQKIMILNIGLSKDAQGVNVSFGKLKDLKVQTNIKPNELKMLLQKSKYGLYPANNQTPLKNSNAVLNWVLKDGYYTAEFSGLNNTAIDKEAQIIFRKLNQAAGRDVRLIDDKSTIVYTYNTNYKDKGILLNTLIEHGAQELSETGDEISCKLFDMEMIYHKDSKTGAYVLDITQVKSKDDCSNLINDLNEEYGLNIQEMTYNKIKERLDSENLRLESEEVLDDNSILLTIEV